MFGKIENFWVKFIFEFKIYSCLINASIGELYGLCIQFISKLSVIYCLTKGRQILLNETRVFITCFLKFISALGNRSWNGSLNKTGKN